MAEAGDFTGKTAQVGTQQSSADSEAGQANVYASSKSDLKGGQQQINREFQEKDVVRRAKELGLPYVNIGKTVLNPDFLRLITGEEAKKARLVPFFRLGKNLRVAVEDFNNPETTALIKALEEKSFKVSVHLASETGIHEALKNYDEDKKYKELNIVKNVETDKIQTYKQEIADMASLAEKLKEVTAEEGLNMLNIGAMKTSASDIHYEPLKDSVVVRFRIDGILHEVFRLDPDTYAGILKQIKYKSKMRLNVETVPQDGRYEFDFNEKMIDVRVASIPTPHGESLVCRLLVPKEELLSFEKLGFEGLALKKIQEATKLSHGMVLVTGPTGSGKTTTLYSLLNTMNSDENKIITLEDPVEYEVEGITQSQIDERNHYDFASGLRSLLRHDPDVVMIGEIRDLETAETAAQAALTGHVLLSTLHTNSAMESIPRLVNMGLPPFMVAPALDTVVAQRLVRKVCPHCHTMEAISDSERKEFEDVMKNLQNVNPGAVVEVPKQVAKVHGCEKCSMTGYAGRIAIVEVFTVGEHMKNLILNKSSSVDLIATARKEGMLTMREDGFLKVAKGVTTIEEVHRATNVSF